MAQLTRKSLVCGSMRSGEVDGEIIGGKFGRIRRIELGYQLDSSKITSYQPSVLLQLR